MEERPAGSGAAKTGEAVGAVRGHGCASSSSLLHWPTCASGCLTSSVSSPTAAVCLQKASVRAVYCLLCLSLPPPCCLPLSLFYLTLNRDDKTKETFSPRVLKKDKHFSCGRLVNLHEDAELFQTLRRSRRTCALRHEVCCTRSVTFTPAGRQQTPYPAPPPTRLWGSRCPPHSPKKQQEPGKSLPDCKSLSLRAVFPV